MLDSHCMPASKLLRSLSAHFCNSYVKVDSQTADAIVKPFQPVYLSVLCWSGSWCSAFHSSAQLNRGLSFLLWHICSTVEFIGAKE